MAKMRRWAAVIACGLLVLAGLGLVIGGLPLFVGLPLIAVGLVMGLWQARLLYQTRTDPYDLSRLWTDTLPDEPEEDVVEDDALPVCHRCGHAVRPGYARCPDCGELLR